MASKVVISVLYVCSNMLTHIFFVITHYGGYTDCPQGLS